MENTNEYKTKDLGESAVLILNNQKLVDLLRERNICWFVFQNKDECQRISNEFFFGELFVDARKYKETMDLLKNRIFARG